MTLIKAVDPGIHTATTSPCLETWQKSAVSEVTAFSEAQKNVHTGIHTATTSPRLVTRLKSQRLVTLRKYVQPSMRPKSERLGTSVAFSDAKKRDASIDATLARGKVLRALRRIDIGRIGLIA